MRRLFASSLLLVVASLSNLHAQRPDPGVVVAWFENRTGDATLDPIGAAAATWISDALGNASLGRVVPSREVRRAMTAGRPGGVELARQTILIRALFAESNANPSAI